MVTFFMGRGVVMGEILHRTALPTISEFLVNNSYVFISY